MSLESAVRKPPSLQGEPKPKSSRGLKPKDLTGKTFDLLRVLGYAGSWGPKRKTYAYWHVQCLCHDKTEFLVRGKSLTKGQTRSCGCLRRELSRVRRTQLRHGESNTPEHKAWTSMRHRCRGTNDPQMDKRYRDRGIRVCIRWDTSYESFRDDMGSKPSPSHSIDRVDNDQGYNCGKCWDCEARGAKANCRWATRAEQCGNRHNSIRVLYAGEEMLLTDACVAAGLPHGTVRQRIRAGWPADVALSLPKGSKYYRRGEGPYAGRGAPLRYSC